MSKNERFLDDRDELRPITVRNMKIGVANPTGFHAEQDFSIGGLRIRCPLNGERLSEFVKYRSLHGRATPLPTREDRHRRGWQRVLEFIQTEQTFIQ